MLLNTNDVKKGRERQISDKWQNENPATIAVAGFLSS